MTTMKKKISLFGTPEKGLLLKYFHVPLRTYFTMILLVVSLFFRFQILILSCVVPEPIYGHLMRGIIVTGLLSQPVQEGERGYSTKF